MRRIPWSRIPLTSHLDQFGRRHKRRKGFGSSRIMAKWAAILPVACVNQWIARNRLLISISEGYGDNLRHSSIKLIFRHAS